MRLLQLLMVLLALGSSSVFGEESQDYFNEYWIYKEALRLVEECGEKDLLICLKERSLRYLNNLPNTIDLGGGLRIKPADGNRTSRQQSSVIFPQDPKEREEALDEALWEKFTDYLSSHSIEYKMPVENINDLEKSLVEEGRKRKGGGGGGMRMKSLLMLIQLKAAVLAAIFLKFIGLVAFKALLVAKIALTISSIVALKKLVEHKPHTSTYEVYAHPHYDEHAHFDRSYHPDMPYRGQLGAARSNNN
ncbi:hypothetical protein NQ315_000505 [Exocentrus adspersus]|uniref:Osiris 9 n=1 Tax=Exocentrus adspersus TaxID=1586481 RepID=A0AAV8V9H5_9CUCU|nr:hypothetical protein NQ315_000505 [Exocentrus adspersus]